MSARGALIGCGFFAENHLNAWKDLAGVDLVAVCDLDAEKAKRAAAKFGVARHYSDAEQMLRVERPDFVDIATTVKSHRSLVEMAARNRVPAICQKPFATTLEDAAAMVASCRAASVPLMVHENFRWQTPMLRVREVIVSGAIGRPFFGRISFRHDYDVYAIQPYLATDPQFAILDVGIHLLDLARFYFGEVESLACTTQRVNPKVRGEDVATILLQHANGSTCIVDCSFYTQLAPNPFPQTLVDIDGSDGSIRLSSGYRMDVIAKGGVTSKNVDAPVRPWMVRPWHVVQDSVRNIQDHWLASLERGTQPDTSGEDNSRTLALGLAAYTAAATGQTVRV